MKYLFFSVLIFGALVSCSNSDNNSTKQNIVNEKVEQPQVSKEIVLKEDIVNYSFSNWEQTKISADSSIKLLGIYDSNNDIIATELISLAEVKEILSERGLLDNTTIIIKVENKEGAIIDLFLVKS